MELNKKTLRNIFFLAAGCIVLYWILHETERFEHIFGTIRGVLSPFLVGACIAFVMNVPMRGIEKRLSGIKNAGARRSLAIFLTLILFILVLTAVFWLLIPQVITTIETVVNKLPGFISDIQALIEKFLADNPELLEWINNNISLEQFAGVLQGAIDSVGNSLSTIVSGAFSAVGTITTILFNAVVSIVFALYSLARKEILARQSRRLLYAFLPERWGDRIIRVMRLANSTFSHFLSGQFLEVCILGAMFAISMAIFKMPYIPLVSVLVAITAFIPLVGAFVGCFLGAFFILVDNPIQAFWFVVMFLVIQQIEGNLIYPRVVGAHIGLPGMWVLLAVAVGGEMMGISGMFLMIPLASVIYTLLDEFSSKRVTQKGISPEKLIDQPPDLSLEHKERKKKSSPASQTEASVTAHESSDSEQRE